MLNSFSIIAYIHQSQNIVTSRINILMKHSSLITNFDLMHLFRQRCKFFPLIDSGYYNWDDPEQREILRCIMMTACDIATITKPWEVQRKAADLVVTEFMEQGDKEKAMLKIRPQVFILYNILKGTTPSILVVYIIN